MNDEARGWLMPFGPELQVNLNLGVSAEEYEALRRRPDGIEVDKDPRWHSHPILGITGHLHPKDDGLHTHVPEVMWGDAVPIASGEDR